MPQQGEAMVILLPRLGKGSQKAAQSGVSGTKATSSWILSSSSGVLGPCMAPSQIKKTKEWQGLHHRSGWFCEASPTPDPQA